VDGGAAMSRGAASVSRQTHCGDCRDTVCALRGLCATRVAPPEPERPLRARAEAFARWYGRPAVRHRAASALVLATASLVAAEHPHAPALAGFAVSTALALWWSAPRATPAGWPGLVAFAAAAGLLAGGSAGGTAWILTAVGLGVAASRLRLPAALGAWSLCAAAIGLAAPLRGAPPSPAALAGCALGAAIGAMISERRRFAEREQQLLAAIAEASVRAVLAEAGAGTSGDAPDSPGDAGVAPSAENPVESGFDTRSEGMSDRDGSNDAP